MIERITTVRNLGRFADIGQTPEWKQITLIYGENAKGKSTLSALLHSLASGNTTSLTERKTIGSKGEIYAGVRVTGGFHELKSNSWTSRMRNLYVFDESFVHENVMAGFEVPSNCREQLLSFVVGEAAVKLQAQMVEITSEITSIQREIDEVEGKVRQFSGVMPVKEFLGLQRIDGAAAELEKRQILLNAVKNSETVRMRIQPSDLAIPAYDRGQVSSVLETCIGSIDGQAVSAVEAQIKSLGDQLGRAWLQTGTKFGTEPECPYCGQETTSVSIVSAYREYFSDAYANLITSVTKLSQVFSATNIEHERNALAIAIRRTLDAARQWPELAAEFRILEAGLGRLTEHVLDFPNLSEQITRKQLNPLGKQILNSSAEHEFENYSALRGEIDKCNQQLEEFRAAARAFLAKLEAGDQSALERQIETLRMNLVRYSEPAVALAAEHGRLSKKKKLKERDKLLVRNMLESTAKVLLDKLGNRINEILSNFGADFLLDPPAYDQRGGKAKANWRIKMREEIIDPVAGSSNRTVRTVLSTGDRRALGFAFFVAKILNDPAIGDAIVVFDDVMSSLDENRRGATRKTIRQVGIQASQVVVLSHEAHFLMQVRSTMLDQGKKNATGIRASDFATFQVRRKGVEASEVVEFDLEEFCRSEDEANYLMIDKHVSGSDVRNPAHILPRLRPLLESHLRRRFFPNLLMAETLGSQLAELAKAEPAWAESEEGKRWSEANANVNRFHHDTSQEYETNLRDVTDTECTQLCKEVLYLIRGTFAS